MATIKEFRVFTYYLSKGSNGWKIDSHNFKDYKNEDFKEYAIDVLLDIILKKFFNDEIKRENIKKNYSLSSIYDLDKRGRIYKIVLVICPSIDKLSFSLCSVDDNYSRRFGFYRCLVDLSQRIAFDFNLEGWRVYYINRNLVFVSTDILYDFISYQDIRSHFNKICKKIGINWYKNT